MQDRDRNRNRDKNKGKDKRTWDQNLTQRGVATTQQR
jgi:hypothetical protein